MIIRRAKTADAAAIMRINVNGWRQAYAGLLPEFFLASREESAERLQRTIEQIEDHESFMIVAVENETILGYLWGGKGRNHLIPCRKEVYALYVDADCQRKGIGRALWEEFREYAGGECFYVCVLKGNKQGEKFYRSMGGCHNYHYDLIKCHNSVTINEKVYFFKCCDKVLPKSQKD